MWIIILLAIAAYYFYRNNKKSDIFISSCNSIEDDGCKMYNSRDIQSKCESLCLEKNNSAMFTGEYFKDGDSHNCECKITPKEQFTQFGEHQDILPDKVPTDAAFSDRGYTEKMQEDRYKKLQFG
jgi:hypothetical protein